MPKRVTAGVERPVLNPMFTDVIAKRPSKRVTLYSGTLELRQGKRSVRGKGTVVLRWLPTPGIEFHLGAGPASKAFPMRGPLWLHIPEHGWRARAFLTHVTPARSLTGTCNLGIGGGLRGRRVRSLHELIFHVPNLARLGTEVLREGNTRWLGRTVFRTAEWEFTLDRISSADKVFAAARREGGFVFTHVGGLRRVDGSSFRPSEVAGLMRVVALFLSFVNGRWTGPLLAVGLDSRRARVWEEWLPRLVNPPRGEVAWAADHVDVISAFPGFWDLATDATLGSALGSIVHWYVEANRQAGALDGALVLLQCGFELLAWMELVMRRATLTATAFEGLPAKVLMTQLMSSLRIPTAIPRGLPVLRKNAPTGADGPAALTAIRNRIVHPPKKKQALKYHGVPHLVEAWRYSLWAAELCVLAMIGYRGRYQDRIRHRRDYLQTAKVPWT